MTETARWGTKVFGVSAERIVPLMDLKVSMSVKSDSQSDSSGTSQTNIQGREPEVVSLSTQYLRGTGSDPWAQVEEWRSLQGQSNSLYIGGKQFGSNPFMLKSVEASDIYMSNSGEFIGVKVSITFEEKAEPVKTTAKPKTNPSTINPSNINKIANTAVKVISTPEATEAMKKEAVASMVNSIAAANSKGISPVVYAGLSTAGKASLVARQNRTGEQVDEPNVYLPESVNAAISAEAEKTYKETLELIKKGG